MAKKQSADALAGAFVKEQLAAMVDPGDWIVEGQFGDVVDALLAELPDHVRKRVMTLDQECECYDRIKAALSTGLQEELFLLNEWKGIHAVSQAEAGFIVGLEVGRRLGGAK